MHHHSFKIHLPFFVDPILSSFPAARICCRIYRTPLQDNPVSPCSSCCVTDGLLAIALWILSVLVSSVSALASTLQLQRTDHPEENNPLPQSTVHHYSSAPALDQHQSPSTGIEAKCKFHLPFFHRNNVFHQ